MWKFIGGGVLVLFIIGSIFGGSDDEGDDPREKDETTSSSVAEAPKPKDIGDELGAQVVCRDFIEDRLKSPASADFSDEDATHVRGRVWTVTGAVDSENSFGAMIRNTYSCTVRYVGEERYRLQSLRGLTR